MTERAWPRDYPNHSAASNDIADYIVSLYNSVRLHSKLSNLPLNAFELKSAINQYIGLCE
jgi:putative transposase